MSRCRQHPDCTIAFAKAVLFVVGITTAPTTAYSDSTAPADGRRVLQQAIQSLRPQPSTDTSPVAFSVGGLNYVVPRNYILTMDNWSGGPQVLVTLRVNAPDMKPLTAETLPCFTATPASRPPGCLPFQFALEGPAGPSAEQAFDNATLPRWPFLIAAVTWVLVVIPLVYDVGGLIDVSRIPALIILPLVSVLWSAFVVCALIRRHWRTAIAIFISTLAFVTISSLTLIYAHQIRFWAMWPIYSIEVARLPSDIKDRSISWPWSAGYGYQETLLYDEQDRYAPSPRQSEYVNEKCPIGESCKVSIRHIIGHFYLSIIRW